MCNIRTADTIENGSIERRYIMAKVTYDYSKALKFVSEEEIELIRPQAEAARDILLQKLPTKRNYRFHIPLLNL